MLEEQKRKDQTSEETIFRKDETRKMKLDIEDLKRIQEEMEENEVMREYELLQALEHEDAGDRA